MDRNLVCELLNEHKKVNEGKQGIIISCTGITIQTLKVHEIEKKSRKQKKIKSQQKINRKKPVIT